MKFSCLVYQYCQIEVPQNTFKTKSITQGVVQGSSLPLSGAGSFLEEAWALPRIVIENKHCHRIALLNVTASTPSSGLLWGPATFLWSPSQGTPITECHRTCRSCGATFSLLCWCMLITLSSYKGHGVSLLGCELPSLHSCQFCTTFKTGPW